MRWPSGCQMTSIKLWRLPQARAMIRLLALMVMPVLDRVLLKVVVAVDQGKDAADLADVEEDFQPETWAQLKRLAVAVLRTEDSFTIQIVLVVTRLMDQELSAVPISKASPVQNDDHFHTVCRYVERNALAAKIVKRAEKYRWGSLYNWLGGDSIIELATWPVRRLPGWTKRVNAALSEKEVSAIRHSVKRGKPYGDEKWTAKTVKKFGLESTMRPRGRPKKRA